MMTESEKLRTQNQHKNYASILGQTHWSQAVSRLNKIILIFLASQVGQHICLKCNQEVIIDDFTIGHIRPWRKCLSRNGDVNLFWSIDNINLQHNDCNTSDNNARSDGYINSHESIEFDINKNISCKFRKRQLNFDQELLGMSFGKARHKLIKKIIFEWSQKCNLNNCTKCKKLISNIDDFSIEHIIPWMSGETDEQKRELFYSISNIGFSHFHCNCASANLGKGKSGYNGVSEYYDKRKGYKNWRAMLNVNGKRMTLKHSNDPIEAAEAYDLGILKYRNGEGILNFPEKIAEYQKQLADGWREPLKCRLCGDKHFGQGYCRKHHYAFCGGKEKRRKRYIEGNG
jgi:hypothetical protein